MESSATPMRLGSAKTVFTGRILLLPGAQRPGFVVKIEDGRNGNQVHVGFVIGLDGADVAPILRADFVLVDEVVGVDAVFRKNSRQDVAAEIVLRIRILGVGQQRRDQELRVENIDAHGGVDHVRVEVRALGRRGLFLESDDAPVRVGFDDAEAARRFLRRDFERGDGHVGSGIHMLLEHLLIIHFVDVVAGENDDVARVLAADRIDVLIHGIGGAQIPVRRNAHLRRQDFDEFAEAQQLRPALADVPVQRERFVLCQDEYAAEVAVDAVGKGNVNNSVDAAEGHGGLGAVARQRPEPLALSSSQ